MVKPSRGSVILIPFPFSDLSQNKLRPIVILAEAGNDAGETAFHYMYLHVWMFFRNYFSLYFIFQSPGNFR